MLSSTAVPSDDWFRNTTWNPGVEKAFFEKLARARTQRDQYLAIQAITLARHQPQAALQLVDHYFDTRNDEFHDVQALLAKVIAYETLDDRAEVIRAYNATMAREAEFPKHKTTAYVEFPYMVAGDGIEDEYTFALQILEERRDEPMFPLDRFMWHASYALISSRCGDRERAIEHAKLALAAAWSVEC